LCLLAESRAERDRDQGETRLRAIED
jgi:hypothetical protein